MFFKFANFSLEILIIDCISQIVKFSLVTTLLVYNPKIIFRASIIDATLPMKGIFTRGAVYVCNRHYRKKQF